jgi:CDP-glucose 4,6-dehydratase
MLEAYKNKKVFITGHTGFKGSWLSCLLDILGIEHLGYSLSPNSSPSHYNLLNSNSKSIIGDICDATNLKQNMINFMPDIVFHLAAQPLVRESYKDPEYTYNTNVMGTLNVLEAVRLCSSVKAVVIITTDKVYENKEWVHPYRETDTLGGYDIYSSSKACSEILVKSYQQSFFNKFDYKKKHHTLIATARAGNVIGGGDWSADRLVPDIVKAAAEKKITQIRNPESVRPWQHVMDCLFGYLLLGEKLMNEQIEFSDAWNFAPYSFESLTVKEVSIFSQKIWSEIKIEFGKPDKEFHEAGLLKLDNSKALTILGWKPKWNTQTAIEKTIEWYKSYYLKNEIITISQIQEYLKSNGIY